MGKVIMILLLLFQCAVPLHAEESKQETFSLLMERWGSPGLFLLMSEMIIKGEEDEKFNWTMSGGAIDQQLEWLSDEIVTAFDLVHPVALNDSNRPEIHGLIRQAFAKQKMRAVLKQEFDASFDVQQIGVLNKWLNSEVVSRILTAQLEASSLQGLQHAMSYRYKGKNLKRMVLMNKLGASLRRLHTYWDHDRQYINYAGLVVATERVTGYGTRKYREVLDGLLIFEPKERQIAMFRRYLIPYTYRDLSDAEVKQYTDFLNSDVGRTLHEMMNRGIRSVLEQSYIELIAKLEDVYRRDHPNFPIY